MEIVSVPSHLTNEGSSQESVLFVPYTSSKAINKGRVSLDKHMISLITEGEKIMHVQNQTIHLTPDSILMLASGNILFTERLGKSARIKSTMIFFDDQTLHSVLDQAQCTDAAADKHPYLMFERDDYLHGFVQSVNILLELGLLTHALQQTKLHELLLYLNSKHPGLLACLQTASLTGPEEDRLRKVMESHWSESLTLPELAFLCHMSLPTFKRKFEQVYHNSPARWVQVQRLTLAADRLRSKAAKPGEIYLDAGYENHSSFSKAFKQYFGVLPKDYAL